MDGIFEAVVIAGSKRPVLGNGLQWMIGTEVIVVVFLQVVVLLLLMMGKMVLVLVRAHITSEHELQK